jgi:hypothetical protein
LTLFRTKWIRFRNPRTDSIEASSEALSITRISAVVVVASSDSTHALNQRPEFQLMMAAAHVMYLFLHEYDSHPVYPQGHSRTPVRVGGHNI